MKPDWKDAPAWAKWLAMDGCGSWYWHEDKPEYGHNGWVSGGLIKLIRDPLWENTLEERPQ